MINSILLTDTYCTYGIDSLLKHKTGIVIKQCSETRENNMRYSVQIKLLAQTMLIKIIIKKYISIVGPIFNIS